LSPPPHDHTRHLEQAPDEWVQSHARLLDLPVDVISAGPVFEICELRRKMKEIAGRDWVEVQPPGPRIPDEEIDLLPVLGRLGDVTHTVRPRSLGHLKELVGIPNSALRRGEELHGPRLLANTPLHTLGREAAPRVAPQALRLTSRLRPMHVDVHHLPKVDRIDFRGLKAAQRRAVHAQAYNLLYGLADDRVVERRPVSTVRDWVLERARELPALVAKDLVVCDGEKVVFNGYSTLVFNNVVVEGSGEIVLGSNTKLHAYSLKHV